MSQQSNQRILESFRTDMFRQSFIYNLLKFIKSPNGKQFFAMNQTNTPMSLFRFNRTNLNKKIKIKLQHGNVQKIVRREGFSFKRYWDTESRHLNYQIDQKRFNEGISIQESRQLWMENIKSSFLSDKTSFIAQLYLFINEQEIAKWNHQGTTILINDQQTIKLLTTKKLHFHFGFDMNHKGPKQLKYTHQFLNRDSPIQVWIWIQQFYRMSSIQQTKMVDEIKSMASFGNEYTTKAEDDKETKKIISRCSKINIWMRDYLEMRFSKERKPQEESGTQNKQIKNKMRNKRIQKWMQQKREQEKERYRIGYIQPERPKASRLSGSQDSVELNHKDLKLMKKNENPKELKKKVDVKRTVTQKQLQDSRDKQI